MTDKERILTNIIKRLHYTTTTGRRHGYARDQFVETGGSGQENLSVHFAAYEEPRPGDLVLAATSRDAHEWVIGFYVEKLPGDYGGAVIREIGTDNLCNYSNERFYPLRGMAQELLFYGIKYKIHARLKYAFLMANRHVNHSGCRTMQECVFEGNTVRIKVGDYYGNYGGPKKSLPFTIQIQWEEKDTHSTLLRKMLREGMCSREFELVDNPDHNPSQKTTIVKFV